MQYIENKILFLGDSKSPILDWLKSIEGYVMHTSEKITTDLIHSHNIKFIVSYGYKHIICNDILELFPSKAINLHISYLPFNRGSDPNFWSFIEKTPKGVTIHYLDEGIDTGDIIVQQKVEFNKNQGTLKSSYEELQLAIQNLFKENWKDIKNLSCKRQKQVGNGTFHKSKDIAHYSELLKHSWDTPLYKLTEYNDEK